MIQDYLEDFRFMPGAKEVEFRDKEFLSDELRLKVVLHNSSLTPFKAYGLLETSTRLEALSGEDSLPFSRPYFIKENSTGQAIINKKGCL